MKKCRICNHIKPVTSFFKNGFRRKDGTSGTRNECKACSNRTHKEYVEENREKLNAYMKSRYTPQEQNRIREYGLNRMYGLSTDDYQSLLNKQRNGCAICKRSPDDNRRPLDVDHSHTTGKIRGLLCMRCNRAMGMFQDNPKILIKAAQYLRKNKK